MNILLQQQCYQWLVALKILKPYIIPSHNASSSHQQFIQVCYDDQIYLENGYLIGVLLKDILKGHQLYSQKLIKIRKITVLKKYQNWEIIYDVLSFLDYDEVEPPENFVSERQLIIYEIQNILHFLFHQYGPNSHLRNQQQKRTFHIEPQKLQKLYDKNQRNNQLDGVDMYNYKDCKNVLEYMIMVVKNSFVGLSVSECLGLLVDKGKVLKEIIVKGVKDYPHKANNTKVNNIDSKYNAYECIQKLYQQVLRSIEYFELLIVYEPQHLSQFMSIMSIGAQSGSLQVGLLSGQLLKRVQCSEWFFGQGFSILIKSQHKEILTLIIQKSKDQFSSVFNIQKLSHYFTYNEDILLFLSRLLPVVGKSRFSKQIMQSLNIERIMERALTAFMLEQFEEHEQSELMSRQLSRELIVLVYRCFYKMLSEEQKEMGIIAFDTQLHQQQSSITHKTKLSFIQSMQLLTQLFEIIKIFLLNQDVVVEKWFKIAVKFMRVNDFELKQFVVNNLKQLYFSLGRSFPLGAFLQTYHKIIFNQQLEQQDINKSRRILKQCQLQQSTSLINSSISTTIIPQFIDFHFLQRVSQDLSLVEDEIINTLNITLEMFLQINGNCFINILSNLLKFKQSSPWAETILTQLLTKWTQLKLPLFNTSNLYNRKSPIQKCKFEAFGIKRREILKFQEYQKYKMLLQILCNLKDKQFLRQYYRTVNKKMQEINREAELKPYGVFLKKLLEKIKLSKQLLPQIAIDMMEKSLMRLSQNYDKTTTILMNDSRQLDDMKESHVSMSKYKSLGQKYDQMNNEGKEQMNEFLSSQQMKNKKQFNEVQNNSNERPYDQVYNPIQPFTSQDQSFPFQQLQLFSEQQMQNHEILYIRILRENHPYLVDYCCGKLVQNMNSVNESREDTITNGLRGFLRQLKIEKYIGIDQVRKIFYLIIKQQEYSKTNKEQLTWKLLVQMAFCIFGFRRMTRVRVKLIQTLISILQNTHKQQLTSHLTIESSVTNINSMMRRQMVYQNVFTITRVINWNKYLENVYLRSERVANISSTNNRRTREQIIGQVLDSYHQQQNLSNISKSRYKNNTQQKTKQRQIEKNKQKYQMKKVVKNQLEPYLISFQIINDILLQLTSSTTNKHIGFGLVEPISTVVTKVKLQNQYQSETQQPNDQIIKTEQQQQLHYLEMELQNYQKERKNLLLSQHNKRRKDSNKSPILSLIKSKVSSSLSSSSYTKKIPNQNFNFQSQLPPQFSKLSTLQLKDKINSRKAQLEEELKKKPKKLHNQNFSSLNNPVNRNKKTTPLRLDSNDTIDQQTRRQVQQLISYNIDEN